MRSLYGSFFQASQIVAIYNGATSGENEINNYAIKNNYEKNVMQLNVEGGYPEVKQLYMGARLVNSPNYPYNNKNRDRSKYNYYLLGDLTIVTLKEVVIGGEFLIDCQYNI